MVVFVAKYNKLDVEICNAFPIKVYSEKGGVGEEYFSKFHTGKVPALETDDGFCVYESNAVAWFCKNPVLFPPPSSSSALRPY
jgi:elongation factor 1-gamma